MDINEYQDFLRKDLENYSLSGRDISATYLIYFLEKYFEIDPDIAVSCVCDNNNDKGIDAIYVDDLQQEIYIFQCKFKTKNNATIGDSVLRDFTGVKSWFEDSTSVNNLLNSTINKELKNLLVSTHLEEKIDSYNVSFHFLTNALYDYNTNEYLKVSNDIVIWDLEQQKAHYHFIKDEPLVIDSKIIAGLASENTICMDLPDGNRSLIFPIQATDLVNFNGINDYTLFSKNVRYGLGNTRVNKSIKNTLENAKENKNFFIFHNGISMICEKFNHDIEKGTVEITNYSIVNGAQSTLTFYNNKALLTDNIKVLLRIVEVGDDPSLSETISTYNNNQNSISMKDLRSNSTVQKRISREFDQLKQTYHINLEYIAKSGKKISDDCESISSDYAAQLVTSCYLKEPYNTHLKNAMFDANYNKVFNRKINAYNITMYFNSHKILKNLLDKIDDPKIANYGLAQHFILTLLYNILGKESATNTWIHDSEEYIKNINYNNETIEKILNILITHFNFYMKEQKKDEFDYKNFFKSKEEVESLLAKMLTMFTTSLQLNGKEFEDILK